MSRNRDLIRERYGNAAAGPTSFAQWFGYLEHILSENRLGVRGLSYVERRGEGGKLMQALKIVKALAEIQANRGALFQIRGNGTQRELEKDCTRACKDEAGKKIVCRTRGE